MYVMSSPEGNSFVSLESALISPFLRCKNFHFKRKSSLFLLSLAVTVFVTVFLKRVKKGKLYTALGVCGGLQK